MKTSGTVVPVLMASLWIADTKALAADDHGHRHHNAHVHGVAELNIAQEGNQLFIELVSPAANIVGFEHAPRNDAQHQQVKKAVETLKRGGALFKFSAGARCAQDEVEVESDLLRHSKHGHHDHKGHKNENTHGEFSASYGFTCGNMEQLTSLDVKLFSLFDHMETINVQLITQRRQGSHTLSHRHSHLDF